MLQRLEASPAVVRVLPSDANFLLVQCRDATRFLAAGKAVGLLVRDFSSAPRLDGCLRISVGTPEQNARLLDAVEQS
jgi:histidinol-phosphate/aromatic aminotransferase/cobyric acid decarboxylase-like protein